MITMINTTKLLYIFNVIIGALFVAYVIYIRLIVIRLPKSLYMVEDNVIRFDIIILVFIGMIVSIYILKKSILGILKIEDYKPNIFVRIAYQILQFLMNALTDLYYMLTELIPDNYEKLSYMAQKFYTLVENKSETLFLFILYLIRFIILTAFLTDVFIFFKLNYMYKALYLLCIFLLIKLWFYTLRVVARNLTEIKEMLIITPLGIDPETQIPITHYNFKDEFVNQDLKYYVEQYILCNKLTGYLETYDRYDSFFTPRIIALIHALYLCGWFYILHINFITFF